MIAPTNKLMALTALIGGAAALAAAIIPALTIPAITLSLAFIAVAMIDAGKARRTLTAITIRTPALIRTIKQRRTDLPYAVKSEGNCEASFEFPHFFETASPAVNAGSQIEFESPTRGEFQIRHCHLKTNSILNLWTAQKAAPIDLTIRVYPNLRTDETAAEFLKRGAAGTSLVRLTGKGREFEKLRDYTPGDSYDEVDWKATARRGKPVVRVFQVERTQEIYVAIDASRLSARPLGSQSTLEHYVNAALVMGLAAEAQGDRFGLLTFSDRLHKFVPARAGKQHYITCRDAIYRLQPRIVEPDFGELFAFLEIRLTKRALVVVLTALDDPLIGETFARYVSIASRRHLIMAAMIRPQGVEPLFQSEVSEVDEIYALLAGHLRWRKLLELTTDCRRKGVRLHLLRPDKISGQLTSLYLDVKRRQQL